MEFVLLSMTEVDCTIWIVVNTSTVPGLVKNFPYVFGVVNVLFCLDIAAENMEFVVDCLVFEAGKDFFFLNK